MPQPTPYEVSQLRFTRNLWVVFIALLIFMLWYRVTVYAHEQKEGRARQMAYEASPGCTIVPPAAHSRTPCTSVRTQIAEKRYKETTGSKTRDTDYYLTLQGEEVEVDSVAFWRAARVGDPVTIKRWQGDIVSVSGYGHTTTTNYNPQFFIGGTAYLVLWLAGIFEGIFGLVLVKIWVRKRWQQD